MTIFLKDNINFNVKKDSRIIVDGEARNASISVSGTNNRYNNFTVDGVAQNAKADIEAKMVELQADYDAKQYQRDRVYPSIGDQLDMQYKDLLNGTTTWKDAVAKVKADNPKD